MIESVYKLKMNEDNKQNLERNQGFDYAVQLTRLLLMPCGIWPAKFSSRVQRFLRPFLIVACCFVMLFLLVPVCLFMFLIVRDVRIRIKLLGPLGFSLMSLFKYAVVIIRSREIEKCIQNMLDDWQQVASDEDRDTMFENARTGRVLTMVCMFLMYGGGMPYVTIVPLAKGATMVGNVSYRALAYPSYFIFFNPYIRPVYDVVFLTQCLCGFTRYTITCGVYSVVIICVMHICSRITVTSSMLQRLADNYDNKLMGTVVKHHLKFLNFAAKLDNIFREIFLVEVMGSTGVICLLGYYFITEYEQRESIATITYFFLLMSFVFNIFILCYIGQVLTEKCESIAKAAYTTKWYQLTGKEARSIVFIVSCNHRPVELTAGKLLKLSLNSFSSIIKAAAGYLNILRTAIVNSS
ncbi:odorant receptor 7 [Nasonia vitripennis]|uniref:Odorant receptor n=1 Tax=Nasonia vitripennis TaxID=7425 RepID=A0A7M6UWJ9_NASVI|nr:odorant receptor 7 [Nasonia vitripennis]